MGTLGDELKKAGFIDRRQEKKVVDVAEGAADLRPLEAAEGEEEGGQTDQEPYPEQRASKESHRVSPARRNVRSQ